MKLSQVIRRYLIFGVFIVIILGCISHYFIFKLFIHHSTDKVLYEYKEKIVEYVNEHGSLATYPVSMIAPSRIEEYPIRNPELYPEKITDTLIYSPLSGKNYSYRQLHFTVYYNDQWHKVVINRQMLQTNDMIMVVVSSLFVLFILFFLSSYFITYYIKRNIWDTFYKNLKELDNYNLKANTSLHLVDSRILEFDKLNEVIRQMVKKINEDYENSRVFIEDASHEMQTPLSIIKSKIDFFVQDNSFKNEEQVKDIQAILRAITRLSKLSRSLSLLTKINNNQFENKKEVDIPLIIENYLTDFKELIDIKGIDLQYNLESFISHMDAELSEILISNLLNNAIRHNIKDGYIKIESKPHYLLIENSCIKSSESEDLFTRFVIRNKSKESTGLGLNIVKSICDKNNCEITYNRPKPDIFVIKIFFSVG